MWPEFPIGLTFPDIVRLSNTGYNYQQDSANKPWGECCPRIGVARSTPWICRLLRRLDCHVLEGVRHGILDNNFVPAVVGDGVVEKLRRLWI